MIKTPTNILITINHYQRRTRACIIAEMPKKNLLNGRKSDLYEGKGSVTASVAHTAKTHFLSLTVTITHTITQPQAYYSTKPLDPSRLKHYNHSNIHYIHEPVLVADFHIHLLKGSITKLSWLALTIQMHYQII
jgi:hypothetical protein